MKAYRWHGTITFVVWLISACSTSADTLTVSPVPVAVAFTLTHNGASNQGLTPIAVVTTWTTLAVTRTGLALYAYFGSASAALANTNPSATVHIPSSRIEVSVNGGANQSFTQTLPFGAASAGRQILSQAITALTLTGTRTDTLTFNINLSGYTLPAGTYVGVLRFRARATP